MIKSNGTSIYISATLIRRLTDKHNMPKEGLCPRQIKEVFVERAYVEDPTEAMLLGLYGEELILGVPPGRTPNIPKRHKTTGKKLAAELRIDEMCQEHGLVETVLKKNNIEIIKNVNTQIPIYRKFEYKGKEYIAKAILDVFPTTFEMPIYNHEIQEYEYVKVIAMVDIKFTTTLNRTFGDMSWGAPQYMDMIQGDLYNWIVRGMDRSEMEALARLDGYDHVDYSLLTPAVLRSIARNEIVMVFAVFDYSKGPEEYAMIERPFIKMSMDPLSSNLVVDRSRQYETMARIQMCIDMLEDFEDTDWPFNPTYEVCSKCPVNKLNGGYCVKYSAFKSV